jgi:hypothetical protein
MQKVVRFNVFLPRDVLRIVKKTLIKILLPDWVRGHYAMLNRHSPSKMPSRSC